MQTHYRFHCPDWSLDVLCHFINSLFTLIGIQLFPQITYDVWQILGIQFHNQIKWLYSSNATDYNGTKKRPNSYSKLSSCKNTVLNS